MYSCIAAEIANPHKKTKNASTFDNVSLLEFTDTIEKMIKLTIKNEIKFKEMSNRFGQIEQSISMIQTNENSNDNSNDSILDSDNTLDINDNDVAHFEPTTSNGTVIMHINGGSSDDKVDIL